MLSVNKMNKAPKKTTLKKKSPKKKSPSKIKPKQTRSPKVETKSKTPTIKKPPRHKVNVFIDLDQTVISAEPLVKEDDDDEGDEYYDIEANKKKARLFNYKNMEGYYIIFETASVYKNFWIICLRISMSPFGLLVVKTIVYLLLNI